MGKPLHKLTDTELAGRARTIFCEYRKFAGELERRGYEVNEIVVKKMAENGLVRTVRVSVEIERKVQL